VTRKLDDKEKPVVQAVREPEVPIGVEPTPDRERIEIKAPTAPRSETPTAGDAFTVEPGMRPSPAVETPTAGDEFTVEPGMRPSPAVETPTAGDAFTVEPGMRPSPAVETPTAGDAFTVEPGMRPSPAVETPTAGDAFTVEPGRRFPPLVDLTPAGDAFTVYSHRVPIYQTNIQPARDDSRIEPGRRLSPAADLPVAPDRETMTPAGTGRPPTDVPQSPDTERIEPVRRPAPPTSTPAGPDTEILSAAPALPSQEIRPARDEETLRKQFFFIGEWIPDADPLKIGEENYETLENYRYNSRGIEGVQGYRKVNTRPLMVLQNNIQTEFSETDPSSCFSVGENGIEATSVSQDAAAAVSCDYGANFAGDWEHQLLVTASGTSDDSRCFVWGLGTEEHKDLLDALQTGLGIYSLYHATGTTWDLRIQENVTGTTRDAEAASGLTASTSYWVRLIHDADGASNGRLTVETWSMDAAGDLDSLVQSASMDLDAALTSHRYLFLACAYNDGTANREWSGNAPSYLFVIAEDLPAGFYYRKDTPAEESYCVVQAEDLKSGLNRLFVNETAIGDQGQFEDRSGETLLTESENGGLGRFALWPRNTLAYANGRDVKVWAGEKAPVACAFTVDSTPTGVSFDNMTDFTAQANNTLDDADQVVRVGGGNNSDCVLLLHGDGTDGSTTIPDSSSGGGHGNATVVNSAQLDTDQAKFGVSSIKFPAVGDYITFADSDDWDFGSGCFTIDFWIRFETAPSATSITMIYQGTGSTDWELGWNYGTGALYFTAQNSGSQIFQLFSTFSFDADRWYHIAVVRGWGGDTDLLALCVDGTALGTDTAENTGVMPNATTTLRILSYHNEACWVDEFRILKGAAAWTANFSPSASAYRTADNVLVLGTERPASAFHIETASANSETGATLDGKAHNGASWADIADFTDNTSGFDADGEVALSASAFEAADTVPVYIAGRYLHWYALVLSGGQADLKRITCEMPPSDVQDLWDGVYRACALMKVYHSSTWTESTLLVAEETPSGISDPANYAPNVGGLTSSEYIECYFTERMTAIELTMWTRTSGKVNTNSADIAVYYWTGSSYAACRNVYDFTSAGTAVCLKSSGVLQWTPPDFVEEAQKVVDGVPLWAYRIMVTATLSSDVYIDRVRGITAPKKSPKGYVFPFTFANRPMLCGYAAGGEGHRADYGMTDAVSVWNGEDSSDGNGSLYFGSGGELTCACQVYNRFGSNIYNTAIFCKKNETWLLNGYDADTWRIYQLSGRVGCPAPKTMDTAEMGYGMAADAVRHVACWLSYQGPVICDAGVISIHKERISHFFDPAHAACINWDAVEEAAGWVDPRRQEYNLLLPTGSSTVPDRWICFDLHRKKWFEKVPAGDTPYPRAGFRTVDEYGRQLVYAVFANGYMRQLETGTSWDGSAITAKVKTGDHVPTGDIWDKTRIRRVKLLLDAVSESTAVSIDHYADGGSSADGLTSVSADGSNRFVKDTQAMNYVGWSHQFEMQVETEEEETGVALLGWGYEYQVVREDT